MPRNIATTTTNRPAARVRRGAGVHLRTLVGGTTYASLRFDLCILTQPIVLALHTADPGVPALLAGSVADRSQQRHQRHR